MRRRLVRWITGAEQREALEVEARQRKERLDLVEAQLRNLTTPAQDGVCVHQAQPHTVWWMADDGDPIPVPLEARFDNRADAIAAAAKLPATPHLLWAKVFRSDNESYTCWRWPDPESTNPKGPTDAD